jgi:hypothetical protein
MTQHPLYERSRRAETARTKEIEAAWYASIPAETARAFEHHAAAARARGPLAPSSTRAPGTMPDPPHPRREPDPLETDGRGGRGGRS